MPAHFCTVTGARIVAPGVSKAVDPEHGHDECVEMENGPARIVPQPGSELAPTPEPTTESKADAPKASADKPAKSGK